jgi:hypothetical protein
MSSIGIATMGMYRACCEITQGGGAPPYNANAEEEVKPVVFVKNVEMKTTNDIEDYLGKIKAKLISFENKGE